MKSASLEKVLDTAMAALYAANNEGEKAVTALSKVAKTLTAAGKSLSKKRATLAKRKKATSAKLKKSPNAETRKLLKVTVKELNTVKALAAKSAAAKSANTEELAGLKTQTKRTRAYLTVLEKADKVLNKPKKKSRKKRAKKA